MTQLQTICSFRDLPIAELAKTKLTSEGIACFLVNKHHIAMNWLISNALGGVKLQVYREDAARAEEILREDLTKELDALEHLFPALGPCDHCPKCQSVDVMPVKLSRKAGAWALLLGLPLIMFGKRYRCRDCGHIMKEDAIRNK